MIEEILKRMDYLYLEEPELSLPFTFDRQGKAVTLEQFIYLYRDYRDVVTTKVKALSELTGDEQRQIALAHAQFISEDVVLQIGRDSHSKEQIIAALSAGGDRGNFITTTMNGNDFIWRALEAGKAGLKPSGKSFKETVDDLTQGLVTNLNYNVLKEAAEEETDPIKKKDYEDKAEKVLQEFKEKKS